MISIAVQRKYIDHVNSFYLVYYFIYLFVYFALMYPARPHNFLLTAAGCTWLILDTNTALFQEMFKQT